MVNEMFRKSAALIALALFVLAGTAACTAADPGWPPEQTNFALIPVPVNADVAVGENRLLFNVLDKQNQSVASTDRSLSLRFFHLASSRTQSASDASGTFMPTVAGRPGLYRAMVTFDRAGDWGVEAAATEADGSKRIGRFVFPVRETSSTPLIGAQAPASDTQTATTAAEIAGISTDDDPNPDFYRESVAGALAARQPFLVIFATPAFCTSATCGPTLDTVKTIAPEFKDRMAFIHVEPYELESVEGHLQPVLSPENLPISVPSTVEWGLPTEPYLFVVDADGKVTAKFEGIAAPDELRTAFQQVVSN